MADPVKFDSGDVRVEEVDPDLCEDCDIRPADHKVVLDLRAMGMTSVVFAGCEQCCEERASDLRESLPPKA